MIFSSICKIIHLYKIYLFCFFATVLIFFNPGCESLPSKSEGPDNPLDPSNPNNKINGPALVLSPIKITIENKGQFQLELWIVESDSIASMSTKILYDPSILRAESVDSLQTDSESFFLQNAGQLLWLSTINNDSGFIKIDCAVVEGEPKDVKGCGIISRILFQHLSGTEAGINISSDSQLRNSKNDKINPNDFIGAEINIK